MGLDMYLYQELKNGEVFRHQSHPTGIGSVPGRDSFDSDVRQINKGRVQVAYWRKANAIHDWFVRECQGGVDECQETPVSWNDLTRLRDLCAVVLKTKKYAKLSPVERPYFGPSEVGDWYHVYLEDTVDMLSRLDPCGTYVYQSSW